MLSRIVVGTLSTINTIMTPFAGSPETGGLVYQLEPTREARIHCPTLKSDALSLKIDPTPDSRVQMRVAGRLCFEPGKTKLVSLDLTLPADLLEDQFLEGLPVNAPYIVSDSTFGIVTKSGKNRLKLTKRAEVEGLTPLMIEWVPPTEHDKPLHEPMVIWFRRAAGRTAGLSWERIEFRELDTAMGKSFGLNGGDTEKTQVVR